MSEDNQTLIPRSFVELFVPPGRIKPTEPRDVIARRYDLCEDLAQMLIEAARARLFELGITESDVLDRIHLGLLTDAAVVNASEARWVLFRLAELLEWPAPVLRDPV
jgi:Fe2+ transport system protein FeoA